MKKLGLTLAIAALTTNAHAHSPTPKEFIQKEMAYRAKVTPDSAIAAITEARHQCQAILVGDRSRPTADPLLRSILLSAVRNVVVGTGAYGFALPISSSQKMLDAKINCYELIGHHNHKAH